MDSREAPAFLVDPSRHSLRLVVERTYPQLRQTPPSVAVFGPRGCGKTRNCQALARHFGLRVIVEGADNDRLLPIRKRGVLYLAQVPIQGIHNVPFSAELLAEAAPHA